jgi:hypothetical protein
MSARVRSDMGQWAMAMVPGDGSMAWSGSEAEVIDGVGSGTSMGSTCMGNGGRYCGAGAGGGSTATSGAASVTGEIGTAGVARDASGG